MTTNSETNLPARRDDRTDSGPSGLGSAAGALIPCHDGALAPGDVSTTHPVAAYLAGLSPRSRRTMLGALNTITELATDGRADAQGFPWHQLRFEHTAALRSALLERYEKPSTVNLHLAALRGVLKAAWRLGLMEGRDYHRAADIASARGSAVPKGRSLSSGEIRALFDACAADETPAGRRDAALLALLYGGGLRREEAVTLTVAGYDADAGSLLIHGKGGKERIAYLAEGAKAALDAWLSPRGEEPGPLLTRVRKDGRIEPAGLTAQAIYNALRKRAKQAGVRSFSPHDLRRTFVGDLLDAGADVATVQKLVGHAQVTTTARYDRRQERVKRSAAELLHVPFTHC